jgi:phage terminase large subunit-like protein
MSTDQPAGQREGIKETADLALLLALAAKKIEEAKSDDDKVSAWEKAGFLTLAPKVVQAVVGIEKIPAELADITEPEGNQLMEVFISNGGGTLVKDEFKAQALNVCVDWALYTATAIQKFRNLRIPPKGAPVDPDPANLIGGDP